jgi:hypothetical protein
VFFIILSASEGRVGEWRQLVSKCKNSMPLFTLHLPQNVMSCLPSDWIAEPDPVTVGILYQY